MGLTSETRLSQDLIEATDSLVAAARRYHTAYMAVENSGMYNKTSDGRTEYMEFYSPFMNDPEAEKAMHDFVVAAAAKGK